MGVALIDGQLSQKVADFYINSQWAGILRGISAIQLYLTKYNTRKI